MATPSKHDPSSTHGNDPANESDTEDVFHDAHFPPDEEARLLSESQTLKSQANALFSASSYDQAISSYDQALAACPNYLDYEIAVLRSNMAACHLKLEDWKMAVEAASVAVECLDRIDPSIVKNENEKGNEDDKDNKRKESETAEKENGNAAPTDEVVEITGDDEESELARLKELDARKRDVQRIRAKALMRRAKAKMQLGGWANLQGAEEDYKVLAAMESLPGEERKVVSRALRELPARIGAAREKEMGEMMGKLKDLGNGFLKPFGLSTDNFNFVQDPKTGGYSMNFQSG